MLQDLEVEPVDELPVLEIDPPAPTKPASLTGALVQRGRDRAARAPDRSTRAPGQTLHTAVGGDAAFQSAAPSPEPTFEASPEPSLGANPERSFDADVEVPLVFAPRDATALERSPSRFTDALFVLACCGAFFATFLFALRF
jgi:hypothetical protein